MKRIYHWLHLRIRMSPTRICCGCGRQQDPFQMCHHPITGWLCKERCYPRYRDRFEW